MKLRSEYSDSALHRNLLMLVFFPRRPYNDRQVEPQPWAEKNYSNRDRGAGDAEWQPSTERIGPTRWVSNAIGGVAHGVLPIRKKRLPGDTACSAATITGRQNNLEKLS